MKKITAFVFFLFFSLLFMRLPTKALADSEDSPTSNHVSWYLGESLGINASVQDWNPDFPLGGGGNIIFGYHLDPSLSVQLSISPFIYTGGGLSICDLRISPEFRWNSPGAGFSSYFLAGPGYDFQFQSPNGYNTSTLAAVAGIGFQFDFHPGEHAFVEGRYHFLIYNNITQQDIPVLLGLSEDL
jgi:hypothetical protein